MRISKPHAFQYLFVVYLMHALDITSRFFNVFFFLEVDFVTASSSSLPSLLLDLHFFGRVSSFSQEK